MGFWKIVLTSFLLTVAIFSLGIVLNYGLDFLRLDSISKSMSAHEISTESYLVERAFINKFGGDKCAAMELRIADLKDKIKKIGNDLNSYGSLSFLSRKDFDYLKRKYILLELDFYSLILELNKECARSYVPVLFFYSIDEEKSIRQGFILEDLSKEYERELVVLSIDSNYEEEPLVGLLKKKYNISKTPVIVINDELVIDHLAYAEELNEAIGSFVGTDSYGRSADFDYVINACGLDRNVLINELESQIGLSKSAFAKGDIFLVLGRLKKNESLIRTALEQYDIAASSSNDPEEKAVLYETIASLESSRAKKEFLLKAAQIWNSLGNNARAKIDIAIAEGRRPDISFNISRPVQGVVSVPKMYDGIVFGSSAIVIDEHSIILSQADRVYRDWLGGQLSQPPYEGTLLSVFSEKRVYNESELLQEIGWHEGGRLKELKSAGSRHIVGYGTIVARHDGKWYAPDEKGVFRFEVPDDKVLYPTTRFLRDDVAVIIDTHGINMLVEQAVRHNATVVFGCCDNEGKIAAAEYLCGRGISVVCSADKSAYLALGKNATILASPPIRSYENFVVVGNQTIVVKPEETIIVMNASSGKYAIWYYETPANYFSVLEKSIPLNTRYVLVNDFNQMEKIITAAERAGASVIAVRIFNSDDYQKVAGWLGMSKNNRAILFHSLPYPYGYKLFKEYPEQTSFGDLNLIFVQK